MSIKDYHAIPTNVADLAKRLGLSSLTGIDAKVDRVLQFLGVESRMFIPEFKTLVKAGDLGGRTVRDIVALAEKTRTGIYSQDLEEAEKHFIERWNKMKRARRKGEHFDPRFFNQLFTHGFEKPLYTGDDILQLILFPGSCTSYAILAYDTLRQAGVDSEVMFMSHHERGIVHSVLRYQLEDGSWKRADPKQQYRENEKGQRIFFRWDTSLREEFASERKRFLNGGHKGVEYTNEMRIRP